MNVHASDQLGVCCYWQKIGRFKPWSPVAPIEGQDNEPEYWEEEFRLFGDKSKSKLAEVCSLTLVSTRWQWSKFSSHCPLSSNQRCWLTSATSTIFSFKFFTGILGIKPGVVWSASKDANHCAMLKTLPVHMSIYFCSVTWRDVFKFGFWNSFFVAAFPSRSLLRLWPPLTHRAAAASDERRNFSFGEKIFFVAVVGKR